MTSAVLTRAVALDERPAHDQADSSHPLLQLTWLDVSSLTLEPGAPLTADDALAELMLEQSVSEYRGQIADLQDQHPGQESRDPFDASVREQLASEARHFAHQRLDAYEQRLRSFVATGPTEDDLVSWLAERAIQDAATYARLDSLDARNRALQDFYDANPTVRALPQRWTIKPDAAAEPKCAEIAGQPFDSYDEAEAALAGARHPGCPHYVTTYREDALP